LNAALLTSEGPGGRATTMTLNQVALNLGTGAGAALGGLLLATGGYGAQAAGCAVVSVGAAAVIWLSRPIFRVSA
jgi:predicted MFS family arabinose efflux permease